MIKHGQAVSRVIPGFVVITLLLASTIPCSAQYDDDPQVHIIPVAAMEGEEQVTQPASPQDSQPAASSAEITVPAGTTFSLGLVRALSFRHTKPGASIDLQFVFPITVGERMVIPPGTYMRGALEEVTRSDRRHEVLAMRLHSAELIFATGYIVSLSGPLDVNPTYGALALPDAPGKGQAPVMAATGPPAPPPLPPLPHIGPSTGAIIGIAVGTAAASAVVAVILYKNSDRWMEAGTPVEIQLSSPLVLSASSVNAAVEQFSKAPPQIIQAPPKMRTCWTPGRPDYPPQPYPCRR